MEESLIQWLTTRLPAHPRLEIGIGDDGAVLTAPPQPLHAPPGPHPTGRPQPGQWVATVDLLTDGVDFRLQEIDPYWVGRKAAGANLSDLAAMAARPLALLTAIVVPRSNVADSSGLREVQRMYDGICDLAGEFDAAVAGGDTNVSDGPFHICITALGESTACGPLTRSGGRPGDMLMATGAFGGSILGRHLRFAPRIREALLLHERYRLTAGIDISDGLSLDASRLAAASRCGAVLDTSSIPIHADAYELAKTTGRSPLEHALGDGEDFELLFALRPEDGERLLRDQPCAVGIARIGELVAEPGLWQTDGSGKPVPLAATGYRHGAA